MWCYSVSEWEKKWVEWKRHAKECHTCRWTCYRGMCVWSDVMIHKFILSVSGLSDFPSTAGFCLRSSFQLWYISLLFQLTSLFYPNNNSLSCFICKFFEIFHHGSADWLVLLFIFSVWFMVVQKCLCTYSPYKMTKTTVWWTLFVDITLTSWRCDDITLYLLIIFSAVNVKRIRACSSQVLSFFFLKRKHKKTNIEHAHTVLIFKNDTMLAIQSIWWAYYQYGESCGQMSIKLMQNRIHSSKLAWG